MTSVCISASFLIAHNPFGCTKCSHFNLPFLTFHVAGEVCAFHHSRNLLLFTPLTLAGSWFLPLKGIFPPLANYQLKTLCSQVQILYLASHLCTPTGRWLFVCGMGDSYLCNSIDLYGFWLFISDHGSFNNHATSFYTDLFFVLPSCGCTHSLHSSFLWV